MTAALEGCEWSAARPGRTLPPGKSWYPFYRTLGGPQGRSRRVENLVQTRIRSRTVQPVAQSYRLSYRAHYIYIYSSPQIWSNIYTSVYIYTGCPRRNVPDFGRVFLMLNYTDITQNNYIQSWTVTEIMAREKSGLLAVPRTAPLQLTHSAREGVLKWMLP